LPYCITRFSFSHLAVASCTSQLQLEERQDIQDIRLRNMRDRCVKLNDSARRDPTWQAMSVLRQRHVMVCLVGKAAGTTWMRVLLRLSGDARAAKLANTSRHVLHGQAAKYLDRFHKLNASTRKSYLTGPYYRVMFVREPLERLVSGYRDKMFRAVDYVRMRSEIQRKFRQRFAAKLVAYFAFQ